MLLLLIRHGETDLTGKQLVGRTPGVHLNAAGQRQAGELIGRLEPIAIDAVYSSPLERAMETAEPLASARGLPVQVDPGLSEIDYGGWTGKEFKNLRRERMWKEVMLQPANVRFPGGETLWETQSRVLASIERMHAAHQGQVIAAFSHGDAIRSAICHLIGLHLGLLQRLVLQPTSVSAVWMGESVPRLLRLNDIGTMADLKPPKKRPGARRKQ